MAALQSGEDVNARKGLTEASVIAPGEPAVWADLGLLQFKQQDYDRAYRSVEKAQNLVPQNSRIEALLGVIESRRGKVPETLAHLKKAVELDGNNLKALYSLAGETERQNSEQSDIEAQNLLERILAKQPNNTAVLVDLIRLLAKRNDAAALRKAVNQLQRGSQLWPLPAQQQLTALEQQASTSNVRPTAIQAQFLRNVLVRVPAYRQSLDEVKTPVTSAGEPFLKFLKLPSPSSEPSAADWSTHFERKPLAGTSGGTATWVGTFVPDDQHGAEVIWADPHGLHLPSGRVLALPGAGDQGQNATDLPLNAVLSADLNYDFKTDLLFATPKGLRFYRQTAPDNFSDVTAQSKLSATVLNGSYLGAWAFDFDLDGDLDVVLATDSGEPLVLRNNGDGTFAAMHPFPGVNGLTDFASADVDGDGDPDVAMLDGHGRLKLFTNERLGDYRSRTVPSSLASDALRVTAADVDGDGLPDFVILTGSGRIMCLSDRSAGRDWAVTQLAALNGPRSGNSNLLVLDLDNNGALDLVADGQVFLSDGKKFRALTGSLPLSVAASADLNNDGRLDLLGLTDKAVSTFINSGSKQYNWQTIRTKAATTSGDQRINSFGIGGEIEVRSELLTQKQIITSPMLHFGLGNHPTAEFARIVWPNGLIQTEFGLKADQTLVAEQRLKGSCPLLFTWNGREMKFLKDVAPMSGALGSHDADGTFASVGQTEEWFKIGGDQLQPRNGFYDLRITDEYWETYYIDRYQLLAVDHPLGTQIFADERVAGQALRQKLYVTGEVRRFASAQDESGRDVSSAVNALDGKYLNSFALGAYQGIAHDHWAELELPPEAPIDRPLYLIAQGWLHPWDDGILVSVNQGSQAKPKDLSLEVPDRHGNWLPVKKGLGVPAGREKTIVLDLSGIFQPGAPRKLRVRTNLEIYWDRLGWAVGVPESSAVVQKLSLANAVLRHRGFSTVAQASSREPEIPQYGQLAQFEGKWRSLEGYYTRYGDVKPLLERSDDRYVIANGGDELRLTFASKPAPDARWTRDYILIGDGWMKEGDYSFKFSNSVLPLPFHGMKNYGATTPAGSLEEDPVYRKHAGDWENFHTRYVSPDNFSAELWKRK